MSEDRLEKYIKENRADFDVHELPEAIWTKVHTELPKKQIRMYKILKIAAIGLLLFMVGLGSGNYLFKSDESQLANIFPPEFIETENYYERQVAHTYNEIQAIGGDENIDINLKALDEVYEELKNELIESNQQNKGQILNAMIKNYQTKTELLNKILVRLEDNKKNIDDNKNNDYEKIEI